MGKSYKIFQKGLCWLRRDLRLHDHHALSCALKESEQVALLFVFDSNILRAIRDQMEKYAPGSVAKNGPVCDRRINFILMALSDMQKRVEGKGGTLYIRYGDPKEVVPHFIREIQAEALFFNRDYEPYAIKRDQRVREILEKRGRTVKSVKDHVIYEKDEVLKGDGGVYKVFTPYKNKWLERFDEDGGFEGLNFFSTQKLEKHICKVTKEEQKNERININKWYDSLGFESETLSLTPTEKAAKKRLSEFAKNKLPHYHEARDFPSKPGTSGLSPYLRHGLISIRQMVNASIEKTDDGHRTWLGELIWRDFYQMILAEFPHVQTQAFKKQYENINWWGKKEHFEKWAEGQTGFPLVDASMRCLNQTGLMPNRLRMLTASFLCKTLLLNWKWGERYFALKLLDYDLAANNGGWQWSASTGCDAQPYFRIFNPYTQSKKFDPAGEFIRQFIPELKNFDNKLIHDPGQATPVEQEVAGCQIGVDYPEPIVDYKANRDRAMQMYKSAT